MRGCWNGGVHIENLCFAFEGCGGIVADEQFARVRDFCFADADEKINVARVPFRVEIVETCPFGTGLSESAAVCGGPVVAVASADGEEVDTLIVLPRLEVDAHFIIVFAGDFVDGYFEAHLRDRNIVELQHFIDVEHGVVRDVEDEPVEVGISGDDILSLPDFSDIGDVHSDILDERHEISGGHEFRHVNKSLHSAVCPHLRFVEQLHECIESHAVFMVFEPVLFGADDEKPGSVGIFQTLDGGVASKLCGRGVGRLRADRFGGRCADGCLIRHCRRVHRENLLHAGVADPFRLHHLADVVAEFIGGCVFEQIAFCDDARIVVVPDEMDSVCFIFDMNVEDSLDPGAVVSSAVVEVGIARCDGRQICRMHGNNGKKKRNEQMFFHGSDSLFQLYEFSGLRTLTGGIGHFCCDRHADTGFLPGCRGGAEEIFENRDFREERDADGLFNFLGFIP